MKIAPVAACALILATAGAAGAAPAPTAPACIAAWNVRPPALPANVTPGLKAYAQALNAGVYIIPATGPASSIAGDACSISIARGPRDALQFAAAWRASGALHWLGPERMEGLIAGAVPNAELAANGSLTEVGAPVPPVAKTPPSATPGVRRTISASGWAGGAHLHATLAQVLARFGAPGTEQATLVSCTVTWPRLGLRASFSFGRSGHQLRGCVSNAIALSFTGGSTWSIQNGLRVGMPASAIEQRYPEASHQTGAGGTTLWYLAPRSGQGSMELTATTSQLVSIVAVGISAGGFTNGVDFG